MAGDHRATANHNIEILQSAGFRKQGNTSIFKKGECSILSPAVSCGQGGHYWFDIRQVNVDKIQSDNSHVLIRIILDKFISIELSGFSPMLSENTKRIRKNSGEVWGFYISLDTSNNKATIISTADSSHSYSVPIVKKDQILEILESM